jgi:putative heme-binding domain-containing protein
LLLLSGCFFVPALLLHPACTGAVAVAASHIDPDLRVGDPARGRLVFHDPSYGCIACHGQPGAGGDIGPDLAGIGHRRSRRYLIDSILRPNQNLASGFGEVSLTTTEGEELSGRFVAEGAGGVTLRVKDADRKVRRVPREQIRRREFRSPMPGGYDNALSRQQLADLVTFLQSLPLTAQPEPAACPELEVAAAAGSLRRPDARDGQAVEPPVKNHHCLPL